MTQTSPAAPTTKKPDSPYVGLNYYTEDRADFFFGRERERKTIIGNLRASRLTLLYAESGVGKSSLLRAGVAPRLRELAERTAPGGRRFLPMIFSSWTEDPTTALIDCIEAAVRSMLSSPAIELSRGALDQAVETAASALNATLLVILDQFEEYFVYRSREPTQGWFADELARCVNRPDLPANFLIALREDAYSGVGDLFKGRIPNVYGNYLHLEFLDRKAGRDAIVKPIERFNEEYPDEPPVVIEEELVEAVLDQVARGRIVIGEAGRGTIDGAGRASQFVESPYLQLVMQRLWDEETVRGSRRLRAATLEELGGADTIIRTHLDEAMDTLPPVEQDAAAAAFRYLVTPSGAKIALSVTDLAQLAEVPHDDVEDAVKILSGDARILRPVAAPGQLDGSRYEIHHDVLAAAILDWRARYERRKEELESEARIERERAEKEQAQREAAEAKSREARERRRKQIAISLLAVVVLALLGTAIALAVVQTNAARQRKAAAESIRSAERVAGISSSPQFGPQAGALAGLESYRLSPTFEARNQMLAALQTNVGLPKVGVGHTRDVYSLAWVNDQVIASGGSDATVRLWTRSGRPLGHPLVTESQGLFDTAIVKSLAVGNWVGTRTLAAARDDGTIDLWDVAHPASAASHHLRTLRGSSRSEDAVAFSPNGSILAAGGSGGTISLWSMGNPDRPQLIARRSVGDAINGLAFSPDGRFLASATAGGVLKWTLIGLLSGEQTSAPVVIRAPASSVAWSSDGRMLAAGVADSANPGMKIWRAGSSSARFFRTTDTVRSVAFARNGTVLVSGGDDWNVTTWDVRSARPFGPPRMQSAYYPVRGVAVSPDGRIVASAGADGRVKLWSLDVSRPLAMTLGSPPADRGDVPSVWDLAVGRGGMVAGAAGYDGALVWKASDAEDGTLAPHPGTRVPAQRDGQPTFAVAYRGEYLAASSGPTFRIWNTGRSCKSMPVTACAMGPQKTVTTFLEVVDTMAFDRTGTILATGDSGGKVLLWDTTDIQKPKLIGRGRPVVNEGQPINLVAFSPTLDVLAVAGEDGTLRVWNVHTPSHPHLLGSRVAHGYSFVASLAFDPTNGSVLASGGGDQQVVLWEVDPSRGLIRKPQVLAQTNAIFALAFSPDGKTLAAGDGDAAVCPYDVASLRLIGGPDCLVGHAGYTSGSGLGQIRAVRFLPDGTLLSAGQGNPVVAWKSILWSERGDKGTLKRLSADACRFAGRNLTPDEWSEAFVGTRLAGHMHETCPR